VKPEELERALRETEVPDAGAARERARRTVLAAHRPARRRVRASTVWVAVAATVAAVIFTARDTGPARAIEQRVRAVLTAPTPAPTPAPSGLAGRMLVTEDGELFVVSRNGRRTSLGPWREATWSPKGLYIGVASGRTLAAIEPDDGKVRWRLRRDEPVSFPRWAPGGLHIAYRSGDTLRIVYGNGLHDVRAGRDMAAVAPAWRPNEPRTVAWAATDGTVTVEDADTAKGLWTAPPAVRTVRRLAWSADGRRLLVGGKRIYAVHEYLKSSWRTTRLPRGSELVAAAFGPKGGRLAVAVYAGDQTAVRVDGETVLTAPGRLRDLEWSPDGRRLLTGWPGADHWLVVRAGQGDVAAVRHRFGATARTRGWAATP